MTQIPSDIELKDEPIKIVPDSLVDETEEDWMRKLWDEIQEANARNEEQGKTPLTELDLDKPQANVKIQSRYNMVEPSNTSSRKASSMKELPLFLGNDVDSVDDIRKIFLQYKLSKSILDTTTFQTLLGA